MPTLRQKLIQVLSEGPFSARDLSVEIRLPIKEIYEHLSHVRKSIRPPRAFHIHPAECLSCGFVFRDRRRLSSPGRCPRCRGSHIQDAKFVILS